MKEDSPPVCRAGVPLPQQKLEHRSLAASLSRPFLLLFFALLLWVAGKHQEAAQEQKKVNRWMAEVVAVPLYPEHYRSLEEAVPQYLEHYRSLEEAAPQS